MVEKREYGFTRFLTEVSKQVNTRRSYSLALRRFLNFVYSIDKDCVDVDYDQLSHKYLDEVRLERDAMTDLSEFSDLLGEMASTTKGTYIIIVSRWLKLNRIDLDISLLKTYKGEREVATEDKPITLEEAERLMSHLSYKHRLATLILLNSGCRISEVIGKASIKLQNVNFTTTPVKISLPQRITKTKHSRITFLDGSTAKYLLEYVKENDIQPDQQIFSMHLSTYQQAFRKACEKTGLVERDVNTERFLIHPYSLRKAFATFWKANPEHREILMGHSLGVRKHYVKPTHEELAQEYVKNMESRVSAEKLKEMQEIRNGIKREQGNELEVMRNTIDMLEQKMFDIEAALKSARELEKPQAP